MLNVEEFLCQRKDLMTRYEQEARAYLRKLGRKADFVEQIPFFADGVADANIWCNADNNFRPLFITKEASIGFDSVIGLPEYYRKWDGITYFEHVDDPFGDIKIGVNKFASNNPWQRIIKLARGLELLCKNKEFHEYSSLNYFGFETGGLRNTNNVSGDPVYEFQTANENYISTVNQIAVINIKKLAGGTNVGSELSVESGFYLDHISDENESLKKLFIEQIELIDPSVIICCGKEYGKFTSAYLPSEIKEKYACKIIECPHPNRSSNESFYDMPIRTYAEMNGIGDENMS